jgi:hypothetical protein
MHVQHELRMYLSPKVMSFALITDIVDPERFKGSEFGFMVISC